VASGVSDVGALAHTRGAEHVLYAVALQRSYLLLFLSNTIDVELRTRAKPPTASRQAGEAPAGMGRMVCRG
jgi:hypothetical protein